MIRQARIADMDALMELAREAKEESPVYRDIPLDEPKVRRTGAMMISSALHWAGVIETNGKVEGALLGHTATLFFSSKKQASDFFFYVREPARGHAPALIRAFFTWAAERPGVGMIGLSNSFGVEIERTESLYSAMGLRRIGGIWLKPS